MAKIFGQLERAQLEVLGADPSGGGLVQGRVWFNSASSATKIYNGTSVIQLASTSATDADAIGAAMTATGANAVAATMTSTGANAIAADRTRATGTSVSAGGIAISNSCGNFVTTSTSAVDVTNLSVTITTSGRPVLICLIPDSSANNSEIYCNTTSVISSAFVQIYLLRDSGGGYSTIKIINLSDVQSSAPGNHAFGHSPGSVQFIDVVSAGTYSYKIQALVNTTNSLSLNYTSLMAREL